MESASIPARPSRKRGEVVREFISRFGLIAILLVLPVAYGIQDLQDDGDLSRLATNIKDGLSNGAIWALIAVGYTLVYGIIELINFAHGDLFMIGSFVSYTLIGTVGLTVATGNFGLLFGLLLILVIAMVAVRHAQRDDRAGRVPTIAQRAQARAADHGGRLLVHPAERRPALARRLAPRRAGPDRVPEALLHLPRRPGHARRHPRPRGDRAAVHLPRELHRALPHGPRHARDGAGPAGGAPDGHQRRHDDLVHVPAPAA